MTVDPDMPPGVPGLLHGIWSVDAAASSAALGVDDWSFGQVESAIAPVNGTLVIPDGYADGPAVALLSFGLCRLSTGHPRLDRRLRSPAFLNTDEHRELLIRVSWSPVTAAWRPSAVLSAAGVTDAARIRGGRLASPEPGLALTTVDVLLHREDFGMVRHRYRVGRQLRLHAQLTLRWMTA
jgi:hypothetical protein